MIHLTLTGAWAGHPICNCNKEEAKSKGDEFTHYMFCPRSVFSSPDLCPKCKQVLDSLDNEEEDQPNASL